MSFSRESRCAAFVPFKLRRQLRREWNKTLGIWEQRQNGSRINPNAGKPGMTHTEITPALRQQAERMAEAEKNLPAWQRQGYLRILGELVDKSTS